MRKCPARESNPVRGQHLPISVIQRHAETRRQRLELVRLLVVARFVRPVVHPIGVGVTQRIPHRFYDYLTECGIPQDSYTRELAFTKASERLGVSYDVLYDAWLNEKPAPSSQCSGEDCRDDDCPSHVRVSAVREDRDDDDWNQEAL